MPRTRMATSLPDEATQRRALCRPGTARWLLLALVLGLAGAGWATRHPGFFVALPMVGVVARRVWVATGHRLRAARALARGERTVCRVLIEVVDEKGWRMACYATVAGAGGTRWRMPFTPPSWPPPPGEVQAECYALPGLVWPALIHAHERLLYPRARPERVEG